MEWIEKHQVFITLIILVVGYVSQAVYIKWQVSSLIKWQDEVDMKLKSIDVEINQIKISDAREGQRIDALVAKIEQQRTEASKSMEHVTRRLDDLHEMFIIALSGGKLGDRFRKD